MDLAFGLLDPRDAVALLAKSAYPRTAFFPTKHSHSLGQRLGKFEGLENSIFLMISEGTNLLLTGTPAKRTARLLSF